MLCLNRAIGSFSIGGGEGVVSKNIGNHGWLTTEIFKVTPANMPPEDL